MTECLICKKRLRGKQKNYCSRDCYSSSRRGDDTAKTARNRADRERAKREEAAARARLNGVAQCRRCGIYAAFGSLMYGPFALVDGLCEYCCSSGGAGG